MGRGRAREFGISVGRFPPGERNTISDVSGVRVGHSTVVRDPDDDPRKAVRTGVTAVFPHEGLPWKERVYVGTHVLNGYGEMIGTYQLNEWGILHSPVVLTSSLAIGRAYDATARWMARHPSDGVGDMPVVSECDDSFLNDALSFPLADEDVWKALDGAASGDVAEGCVGAGTGMQCFDFKGGIGTSSRRLPDEGFMLGALVLTNFGERHDLRVDGVPVGREITDLMPEEPPPDGSCVVIVATDAPMLPHQVRRLAVRAGLGLGRTGSVATNGSGELMIAFSTANRIPSDASEREMPVRALIDGPPDAVPTVFTQLFAATVEAVEEAV
ncbi:MAG: P1 family peptidase, partial [Actinomycetota bacterium]